MVMWFAWVIREEFFTQENTLEGHTETHKSYFFAYKQVGDIVIMNYLEWPMLSYYVSYYEKFRKVMQWTEKEALMLDAWN